MGLTAEEIKATLGLERHPTRGFVTETYRSFSVGEYQSRGLHFSALLSEGGDERLELART